MPDRIGAVLEHGGPARTSAIHGEGHWMRVALAGARLTGDVPGADPDLVLLFALIHDMRRENDGHDPEHGPRAAALARSLNAGLLRLPGDRLAVLTHAIAEHTRLPRADEPTVAVSLDADRLNLWRVGVVPDPRLLSTPAARREDAIEWGLALQDEEVTWDAVAEAFAALR